jgi:hypothetical protein
VALEGLGCVSGCVLCLILGPVEYVVGPSLLDGWIPSQEGRAGRRQAGRQAGRPDGRTGFSEAEGRQSKQSGYSEAGRQAGR